MSTAMTINWGLINPEAFEELCYHILEAEGFVDLKWHGQKGSDRGRDIVCKKIGSIITGKPSITSFMVQCKRYTSGLTQHDLYSSILWAKDSKPDIYLLITTTVIGSNTRDWLDGIQKDVPFKIHLIERPQLETLIRNYLEHLHPYLPEQIYRQFDIGVSETESATILEDIIGLKAAPSSLSLKEQIFQNVLIRPGTKQSNHIYGQSVVIEQNCSIEGDIYGRKEVIINRDTSIKGSVISPSGIELTNCELVDVCGSPIIIHGTCTITGNLITDRDTYIPPNSKIEAIFCGGNNLEVGRGSLIKKIFCKGKVNVAENVRVTDIIRCSEVSVAPFCNINYLSAQGNVNVASDSIITNISTKGSVIVEPNATVKKLHTSGDVELYTSCLIDEITCRNFSGNKGISITKLNATGSIVIAGEGSGYKGSSIIAGSEVSLPDNSLVEIVYSKGNVTVGEKCVINYLIAQDLEASSNLKSECIRCYGSITLGQDCSIGSLQAVGNVLFKGGLTCKDWSVYSKNGKIEGQGIVQLGDTKVDAHGILRFGKSRLLTALTENNQLDLIEEITRQGGC